MSRPRLVVVGWDGADPDLAFRWAEAGELKNLKRLMDRGAWGPLASTTPPATFPAWTSIFTGLGPGRHGITDFTRPVPGAHALRFVSANDRRGETLWQRLARDGRRALVVAVPGTYPPDPIDGVFVSGFDGPVTTGIDPSFVHPRATWTKHRSRFRRFRFADVQEMRVGPGWHERAIARLLVGLAEKASLILDLAREVEPDLLVAVFGESDTASHHFWRFHDSASPRHDVDGGRRFGDAILRVYRSLDAWLGQIIETAGPDATVAVVSDHGFQGSSTVALHLDAALAEEGLLSWRDAAPHARPLVLAREVAVSVLPAALQERLFRLGGAAPAARLESASRYASIDWTRTRAFADEVDYAPGVRIAVRGRDRDGTVAPGAEYQHALEQVAEALLRLRDPRSGEPVVARVVPREQVLRGPCARFAPDLIVEPASIGGYRVSCLRTPAPGVAPVTAIDPAVSFGAKGRGMDGVHRTSGVWVLAGPSVRAAGRIEDASVVDVLPTLLAAIGEPVPPSLDGQVRGQALASVATAAAHDRTAPPPPEPRWYARAAEQRIERRMRALGYLE